MSGEIGKGATLRRKRRLRDAHRRRRARYECLPIPGFDGINLKTWFTAEVRDPKTKKVVNADQVTKGFEGGSALSKSLPRSKVGHGMLLTVLGSISRLALTLPKTEPMPGDEPGAGLELVRQLQETVRPYVDEWGKKPGVLLADGNFFTKEILRESYRSGYLPVIHPVAHPRGGLKALGLNRDGTPISSKPDVELEKHLIETELDPADATEAKRSLDRKLDQTRRNYIAHVD